MKNIIMNKTLIAAAVGLAFAPMAMADTGAEASGYPFRIAFSGGAVKMAAPAETYAPAWLSEYGPDFPGPVTFSNDPDWGHLREARLTWSPNPSWKVVGAYRYGKASAASQGYADEFVKGGSFPGLKYASDPTDVTYRESLPNHWAGSANVEEEFESVDFKVGRNVGIGFGSGSSSVLSVGVRYAELRSAIQIDMDGVPNRYSPEVFEYVDYFPNVPERHYTRYVHSSSAERTFEGYGPTLSWESGLRLLGDPVQGQVMVDWTLTGGVLFGEQASSHDENRLARYYHGNAQIENPTSVPYDETVSTIRSKDVTVPQLSLELGLSYAIQRVQVSLRYSWERYYGAIDGGLAERKTYDRTIQGPVAQISIGFGE
jgi:iron complex outermembrane receptor protein